MFLHELFIEKFWPLLIDSQLNKLSLQVQRANHENHFAKPFG